MASRRSATGGPKRRTLKIRSGDQVRVVSGKDRGKSGRVLRTEPANERVYVEGLNMIKRHTRPREVAGSQTRAQMGGVIEREGPIHISNVVLLDSKVITIHVIPPAPVLLSQPPEASSNPTATFTFQSVVGTRSQCSLDGGPWTACSSPFTTSAPTMRSNCAGSPSVSSVQLSPPSALR